MSDPSEASTRVVFGIHPVEELVKARPRDVHVVYVADGTRGPDMERALAAAKDRGITVEVRPRALIANLARAPGHQGVVAIAGAFVYATVEDLLEVAQAAAQPPLLLLLDGIEDPQNLGALVRSAEVLGAHGVVIPEHHAAPVAAGAVKASAGATERVRIARVSNVLRAVDKLREGGVGVWAAAGERGTPVTAVDLRGPVAIIVGNEGRGVREAVARRCDGLLAIPMLGQVGSLNASAAGAILLYEAQRQRQAEAPPATA